MSRGVSAVLLAAILLLIGATVCTAAVLKVGPGETYTTIGSAIAAAGTNDTIKVQQGTYAENVEIIQDGLKLKGSFGTVIDGSSASLACIKITADDVIVDGFELMSGLDGVEGYNCDDVTIRYCYIHDNTNDGVALVNCDGWRLHFNAIAGNASGGVTTDTYEVDATGNFWGAANGPGGQGPGSGDTVSTEVNYEPWINRHLDGWPAVGIYTATSALPNGAAQTKFGLGAPMQYQVGYSILGPDVKYRVQGIVTAKFDDDCVKTYKETEKGLKRGPHELVFSNKTIPFCAPLGETKFIEYRLKLKKKGELLSEATALSPIILNPAFGIPPTAEFSADPQSGYVPLTVGFADLSTGTIDTWYWDFDGDASWDLIEDSPFSSNPFYTYTDPGTYTVKLKVEGSEGANTEEKVGYIVVSERPQLVTAGFKASPKLGPAPLSVQFTDLSIGTISTWQWDFGDASGTSAAQNPSHVYNAVGTYTVTLTVSGPSGLDVEKKDQYIHAQ